MKVKFKDKIVNLEKFDTVKIVPKDKNRFLEELCSDDTATGFYLVASRKEVSGGIFGGLHEVTEEIIGITPREAAENILSTMIENWAKGTKLFEIRNDSSGIVIHIDIDDNYD